MRAAGPGKRVVIKRDKNGTHYTCPEDTKEFPEVTAWWSRGKRVRLAGKTEHPEYLCIRQASDERADVILLSPGQVYDLIDALTHAVEHA
jgi:4-hydroxy-3-methylbut-2-enyl diphosphate reductase IspH